MAGTAVTGTALEDRSAGPSAHHGLRFGRLIFVAPGVQVLALTGVNSHGFDAAMALVLLSYVALFPAVLVNLRGLRSFSLA